MMEKFQKILIIFLSLSLIGDLFLILPLSVEAKEIKAIRKVLIVSEGQIEEGVAMSHELGVPEVAEGIPPALKDKVTEDMLPYVYEEIIYEEPDQLNEEMKKAIEKLGADIAEYYPVLDKNIEPGDLVSILDKKELLLNVETKYLVEKSGRSYDPKLLGVISSESAIIINSGNANTKPEQILRPVALVGRVTVKVNLQNGPIEIGDYLTSSNIPGVAMKATVRGKVIGMALESLTELDPQLGYGKVMVFMNVGWYDGSSATSTDSVLAVGFFEKLKSIVDVVVDTITGLPKLVINGILEVKNDIVTHGFFKGIVKVAKTVVEGRTVVFDNAATAENSQLEVASEDAESLSFVTYSIMSPRKEIIVSGSGKLLTHSTSSGQVEAKIAFHPSFSAILSDKYPIRVVVTPTSYINGQLYVAEKSIYGFTVKEINSQDEGAEFDWIVTARLTDPDLAQQVLENTETIASQESAEVAVCQNGANRPCSSEIGICQIGVQICEQGVWGECIGAVFPTAEICDEVDNDCDGETDEGDVCSGESGGNATNTAPVAQDLTATTTLSSSADITLIATDTDASDSLTYATTSSPSLGILSGEAPNLIYTPNATGTDFFTYKANDGQIDSNEATVTITITE